MSIASIPTHLKASEENDRCACPCTNLVSRELDDLKSSALWRAALAEFLGVFLLIVFTVGVGLKKDGDEGPSLFQVAVGCGFFLAVIITALSTVSGGHVNPAVSLGFLLTGQITTCRFLVYSIFQVAGAVAGAAFLRLVIPPDHVGSLGLLNPAPGVSAVQAVTSEGVITFLLIFVIMSMVDSGRTDLQGSIPFVVGLTVVVNILYGAKLSGGCMNPVRNSGPAIILGQLDNLWIYWAGPMAGGGLGALVYDFVFSTKPLTLQRCCHGNEPKRRYGEQDIHDVTDQDKLHQHLDNSPESKV